MSPFIDILKNIEGKRTLGLKDIAPRDFEKWKDVLESENVSLENRCHRLFEVFGGYKINDAII